MPCYLVCALVAAMVTAAPPGTAALPAGENTGSEQALLDAALGGGSEAAMAELAQKTLARAYTRP